jgi:hypothetical protein
VVFHGTHANVVLPVGDVCPFYEYVVSKVLLTMFGESDVFNGFSSDHHLSGLFSIIPSQREHVYCTFKHIGSNMRQGVWAFIVYFLLLFLAKLQQCS